MNRALLNPFESRDLMGTIEQFLDTEAATATPDARGTCMAFNRTGNLLAVGTSTGAVIVWDFDTRSVARLLTPTAPAEAACAARAAAAAAADGSVVRAVLVATGYRGGNVGYTREWGVLALRWLAEPGGGEPHVAALREMVGGGRGGSVADMVRDGHAVVVDPATGRPSVREGGGGGGKDEGV